MLDINFSEIKESAKSASARGFKTPGKHVYPPDRPSITEENGGGTLFVKPKNVVREDRSKRPKQKDGGPNFVGNSGGALKVTLPRPTPLGTRNEVATETYPGAQTSPSGFKYVAPVKKIIWSLFVDTKTVSVFKAASHPKGAVQVSLQNASAGIEKPTEASAVPAQVISDPALPPAASTLEIAPVVILAPASAEVRDVLDAQFIEKLKALLSSKERSSALELENKILREQLVAMGGEIALLKAELSIKKG